MASIQELISNPGYLAYKFNFQNETVEFLAVNADEIARVSALKHEYIDARRPLTAVPLTALQEALKTSTGSFENSRVRFIFHTAFCASTFLSRCLDVPGYSTALREPQLLLDAANAKRLQWRSRTTQMDYRQLMQLALQLLSKHTRPNETLVIKPINSVNNIAAELMQTCNKAKSLMLYTDAKNFMLSTLRKGEGGKHVTRSMFDLARCDFPHLSRLNLSAVINMTDWNIILTLWRLQIEQAETLLRQHTSPHTMASLYGEDLIQQPLGSLLAANQFLQLGIPDEQLIGIVNSDKRFEDAKSSGQTFSTQKRAETYQRIEQFYGTELDQVYNWMLKNNPGTQLQPTLSAQLPTTKTEK